MAEVRGDLRASLGNNWQVKYGSYLFSPACLTTALRAQPVEDQAQRTFTHVVYTITLRDYIQSDTGTDLSTVRTQLLAPAQAFLFTGQGFGDLRINVTAQQDCIWGPKPRGIEFTPMGGGSAWRFEWTVEVALPEFGAPTPFGRLMEFNYRLETSVLKNGLSRRVYSGHLRIPQTRPTPGNRQLHDNADSYLEKIVPPLVSGFRRIPGTRTLSEDKCKLTFSMTDEELPSVNVPPPLCVEASASHSLESDDVSFLRWKGVVQASYELVKGIDQATAFGYFMNLVKDRTSQAKAAAESQTVLPVKLTLRERDIYGSPVAEFSLAYTYTLTLGDILAATGLWRPAPAPDNNWAAWSKSLATTAFAPRGYAGLKFVNNDDAIVDLGSPQDQEPKAPGAKVNPGRGPGGAPLDIFTIPAPDESWIEYVNNVRVQEIGEIAVLKPLPQAAVQAVATAVLPTALPGGGFVADFAGQAVSAIIQKRAAPTYIATMTGYALRAVYPIAKPTLNTVGSAAATPWNRPGQLGFVTGIVANWGCPIQGAKWQLSYVLSGRPTGAVLPPPNPTLTTGKNK